MKTYQIFINSAVQNIRQRLMFIRNRLTLFLYYFKMLFNIC